MGKNHPSLMLGRGWDDSTTLFSQGQPYRDHETSVVVYLLCHLRSIAAHRECFVRHLSVCPSVCLVVTHSYVSQAAHAFLRMLPLCLYWCFTGRGWDDSTTLCSEGRPYRDYEASVGYGWCWRQCSGIIFISCTSFKHKTCIRTLSYILSQKL